MLLLKLVKKGKMLENSMVGLLGDAGVHVDCMDRRKLQFLGLMNKLLQLEVEVGCATLGQFFCKAVLRQLHFCYHNILG